MQIELQISGMMCDACAGHVARGLQNVPGVQAAQVDLRSARATVSGENLVISQLIEAVEEEGYSARQAETA
jgi:copper chaperone CopZ